jgi:hypothetical protein
MSRTERFIDGLAYPHLGYICTVVVGSVVVLGHWKVTDLHANSRSMEERGPIMATGEMAIIG